MIVNHYRQIIRLKSGGWYKPMKSDDGKRWVPLKKTASEIYHKIPYAINKIALWHRKHGHRVLRQERVERGLKYINLIISK